MANIKKSIRNLFKVADHGHVIGGHREHIDHQLMVVQGLGLVECQAHVVFEDPHSPLVEPNVLAGDVPERLYDPMLVWGLGSEKTFVF